MSVPEFDPFYSAKVRIDRAKKHLNDLEAEIDQFFAKNPYTPIVEPDPDGVHQIHKLKFTQRFPFIWRILSTEIVEHLRSALDHATWATVYLKTGNPNLEQAAFPFAKTATDLDNSMRRRSKDVPTEIQALLRTFQPYEGGNDILYFLNNLCNLSKHALITFMGVTALDGEIRGVGWSGPVQFYDPLVWDREKHEIKYARTEKGVNFQHQANLRVFIALHYKETKTPVSATAVLDAMLRETERIVLAIEAESRRIELIT
jgi:hypothetical protein